MDTDGSTLLPVDSIPTRLADLLRQELKAEEYSLGFTGPRQNMSPKQRESLAVVLDSIPHIATAHHGDCVGADTEFHELCLTRNIPIHLHPSTDDDYRSFCQGATHLEKEQGYLKRNRAIVSAADILLAAPRSAQEVQRSGIWATIRYARKARIFVILILPDGHVGRIFNPGYAL